MPLVQNAVVNLATVNVNVPTTTETVAVLSDTVGLASGTVQVVVYGWCQLTIGTATTTVTPRIRRGTDSSGLLIGEANAEDKVVAVGAIAHFSMLATETLAGGINVTYVFTVQQTTASGAGTVQQASIMVLVLQ